MKETVFFTSDSHYDHTNIIEGISKWTPGHGQRPFQTAEEHNKVIVDGINNTVGEDDTLYHLGDWSFNGIENIWKFRSQIKCKNIYLILGNHDHHIARNRELPNVHRTQAGTLIGLDAPYSYTDKPVHARELFTEVYDLTEKRFNKRHIVMCHYAMRVWNNHHSGTWHLYGHSHGQLHEKIANWGKSLDVGVDSAKKLLGEYRPFSFGEIRDLIGDRPHVEVDHHNEMSLVASGTKSCGLGYYEIRAGSCLRGKTVPPSGEVYCTNPRCSHHNSK